MPFWRIIEISQSVHLESQERYFEHSAHHPSVMVRKSEYPPRSGTLFVV